MTLKKVNFSVLGKRWVLRVLDEKKYSKKNGTDSVAITKLHNRKIDLSLDGLDLETLIHELTHAYLYEMCLHSTDISVDDLEEVFAELLAKRGRELLDKADTLLASIKS